MEQLETLRKSTYFKVLGDNLRLKILRALMTEPATISMLGEQFDLHPANIRYHLKLLEESGLVALVETREVRGVVAKHYHASARAYQVNLAILPSFANMDAWLITGSHDIAIDLLTQRLHQSNPQVPIYSLPVGSMDGLIALRQGLGHMAGAHLYDPDSGEYNLPFVRHLFPDRAVRLMTVSHRRQGLITAPGNPLKLKRLADLAGRKVRFVNRRAGSGTRLWIDRQLDLEHVSSQQIDGYDWTLNTHVQAAKAVQHGTADASVGLEAAARQFGLGFVPLFEERYDLVIPDEWFNDKRLVPVFDQLQDGSFRRAVEVLGGYRTNQMGVEIML